MSSEGFEVPFVELRVRGGHHVEMGHEQHGLGLRRRPTTGPSKEKRVLTDHFQLEVAVHEGVHLPQPRVQVQKALRMTDFSRGVADGFDPQHGGQTYRRCGEVEMLESSGGHASAKERAVGELTRGELGALIEVRGKQDRQHRGDRDRTQPRAERGGPWLWLCWCCCKK